MPEQHVFAPEALGPTITIGEILVEIMADTVGQGFTAPIALTGPYPSGAPAIFIDQVARMGAAAGMIGAVGRDDFGRVNLDRLQADGVDISAIAHSDTHPTGTAFVRYRQDGNRDFVFNIAESAAGRIVRSPATDSLINKAGHLHVMGSALSMANAWPLVAQALAAIKARGGSVSFDPNIRKELLGSEGMKARFTEVLAVTDCLLPSGDELLLAASAPDERTALDSLLALGIHEIVLKRGALGASHVSSSGRIDRHAYHVAEVDPTGAGDCFGGAYVAARRLGAPLEAALTYAVAAGAHAVTRRGPMEGAAFRSELDRFIIERGSELAVRQI